MGENVERNTYILENMIHTGKSSYIRENIHTHKYAHGARRLNSKDQHCLRFCFQVCEAFIYGGGTVKWHSQHQVPYAFKGNNWVGYDNVRSLKAKVHLLLLNSLWLWWVYAAEEYFSE